jgi:GWxTD domain-containing protein
MATPAIKVAPMAIAILFVAEVLFSQQQFSGPNEGDYYFLEEIFINAKNPDSATTKFYNALKTLNTSSYQNQERLKRLYADVIDIMIEPERRLYKTLKFDSEKVAFFTFFWQVRDLTPATLANERLIEHYQRLYYARTNYKSSFNLRGHDDRGQIYVRFGPPNDKVVSNSLSAAEPVESWVYHGLGKGRAVTFDFVFRGYAFFLTDRLADAVKAFRPETQLAALRDIVRERIALDLSYYNLYRELENIQGDVFTAIERAQAQYAGARSDKIINLPPAATTTFSAFKPLPFNVSLANFKNSPERFDLVAAIGLERSSIKARKDSNQTWLQLNAALKKSSLTILARQADSLMLAPSQFDAQEHLVAVQRYELPGGQYQLVLDLRHPATRQLEQRDFSIMLGGDSNVHLSSVIFAKSITPAESVINNRQSFTRHNLVITPYPFSTFKRNTPIFIYFEIYGLQQDDKGETFYKLEYEVQAPAKKGLASLFASLNPFDKGDGNISISEARRGKAAVEPTYLQLDFGQLRSGKYNLIVRVTDNLTNITKESKLESELEWIEK